MLSRWYGGCWGHQITNPRTNPECWGSWRHHKHITNTPTWSKLLPFLIFCVGSSYSAVTKHLIRHGTSFLDSPFLSALNAPFSPHFSWFWPLTGMDTLYLSPLTLLLYKKEKFHLMGEGGRKGSLFDSDFSVGMRPESRQRSSHHEEMTTLPVPLLSRLC